MNVGGFLVNFWLSGLKLCLRRSSVTMDTDNVSRRWWQTTAATVLSKTFSTAELFLSEQNHTITLNVPRSCAGGGAGGDPETSNLLMNWKQ